MLATQTNPFAHRQPDTKRVSTKKQTSICIFHLEKNYPKWPRSDVYGMRSNFEVTSLEGLCGSLHGSLCMSLWEKSYSLCFASLSFPANLKAL